MTPPETLILGDPDYGKVTSDIVAANERAPGGGWLLAFLCALSALGLGIYCVYITVTEGICSNRAANSGTACLRASR